MGLVTRTIIGASAALGLGVSSQAPEFAQQYEQRLGGAVDELKAVVEDFDRDARNSQMDRNTALDTMSRSPERFSRDRGQSMQRSIARYDRLLEQQVRLAQAAPALQPLVVMQYPDPKVMEGAWETFDPAVPLTAAGAIYGGAGALILGILSGFGIGAGKRMRQRRKIRKEQSIRTEGPHRDPDPGSHGAGPIDI